MAPVCSHSVPPTPPGLISTVPREACLRVQTALRAPRTVSQSTRPSCLSFPKKVDLVWPVWLHPRPVQELGLWVLFADCYMDQEVTCCCLAFLHTSTRFSGFDLGGQNPGELPSCCDSHLTPGGGRWTPVAGTLRVFII